MKLIGLCKINQTHNDVDGSKIGENMRNKKTLYKSCSWEFLWYYLLSKKEPEGEVTFSNIHCPKKISSGIKNSQKH